MRKKPSPRTIATNIIQAHGKAAFQKLIQMFRDGESGAKIGTIFNVSRQRVSQWKALLGTEQVSYIVHPEIQDLVAARQRRTLV